MKLGSRSFFRKEALDGLLHRLYEELLQEATIKKAFLIEESQYNVGGNDYTYFKLRDIPIREEIYMPREMKTIPYHSNNFTIKERIKILFKGRL